MYWCIQNFKKHLKLHEQWSCPWKLQCLNSFLRNHSEKTYLTNWCRTYWVLMLLRSCHPVKMINNDSLRAASTCNTLYNTIQMYLTSIFCSDLDSSQSPLNPIPSSSQLTAWPRPINSFPRSRAWDTDDRPQRIKTSVHNFRRKRESMPISPQQLYQCCSVFGLW